MVLPTKGVHFDCIGASSEIDPRRIGTRIALGRRHGGHPRKFAEDLLHGSSRGRRPRSMTAPGEIRNRRHVWMGWGW